MNTNPAGFEDFVRVHGARLQRFACVLTRDPSAADDLVQSALAAALVRWQSIEPATALAYVTRSVVNAHRRSWRRWARVVTLGGDSSLRGRHDVDFERIEIRELLAPALAKLSYARRTVVLCRYYMDLTEKETADATGLPIGTVKSHARRGLEELRQLLAPSGVSSAYEGKY